MTRIIAVAACDHALLADPLPLLRQCAALGVWAVELRLDYLPDAWLPVELRERAGLGAEDRWPEHGSTFEEFAADGEDSGSAGSLGRIGFRGDSGEQSAPTYSIAKWLRHHIRRAWHDELAVRHGLPRLVATARCEAETGLFSDKFDGVRFALLGKCLEAGVDLVDVEADVIHDCLAVEYYRFLHALARVVDASMLRLPGEQTRYRVICSRHFPEGVDPKPQEVWSANLFVPTLKAVQDANPSVGGLAAVNPSVFSPWSLTKAAAVPSFDPYFHVYRWGWDFVATLGGIGGGLRWISDRIGDKAVDEWNGTYLSAPGNRVVKASLPPVDRVRRVLRFGLHTNEGNRRSAFSSSFQRGGVIGSNAATSLSPLIHNALAADPYHGLRYAPFQTDNLAHGLGASRQGKSAKDTCISITNPLKEQVLESPKFSPDEIAIAVGAANTAKHYSYMGGEDDPWRATNTDVGGFLAALATPRSDEQLAKSRVLVFGYGGSARAVLYALKGKAGAVFVAGRNADKGKVVASKFGAAWHPAPETDDFGFDIVINTTPCGQPGGPAADQSPCDLSRLELNPNALVFDLVYGADTPLAQQARALGIEHEDGLNMLLEQAYLQQQFWGLRHQRPNQATHLLLRGACRRASRGMPWTPPLRIALIGYRGAGKSTVGALLAKQLDIPHVDLDREVARVAGFGDDPGLAFTTLGEAAFRELEGQVLRELSSVPEHEYRHGNTPLIVSCGGGVVEGTSSVINLYEGFTVIDLQAKPETLLARMVADHNSNRPALEPGRTPAEELAIRSARRDPWHRAIADHAIDTTSLTPVQVAEAAHTWLLGIDRNPATRA